MMTPQASPPNGGKRSLPTTAATLRERPSPSRLLTVDLGGDTFEEEEVGKSMAAPSLGGEGVEGGAKHATMQNGTPSKDDRRSRPCRRKMLRIFVSAGVVGRAGARGGVRRYCRALGLALVGYVAVFLRGHVLLEEYGSRLLLLGGYSGYQQGQVSTRGRGGKSGAGRRDGEGASSPGPAWTWRGSPAERDAHRRSRETRAEERRERTRPRPPSASATWSGLASSGKDKAKKAAAQRQHLERYRLSLVDAERRGMPPPVLSPPRRTAGELSRRRRRRLKEAREEDEEEDNDADADASDDDEGASEAPLIPKKKKNERRNANGGDDGDSDDGDIDVDANEDEDEDDDEGNRRSRDAAKDKEKEAVDKDGKEKPIDDRGPCGVHAKEASTLRPTSFPSRYALGPSSRVLVAGILSPLGMNLALKLHRECGVKRILGVDPMLPNTVPSRLEYVSRIKALHRELGDALVLPLIVPYVGLDPILSDNKVARSKQLDRGLGGTWEADVTQWSNGDLGGPPTHVVNVASAYRNSYRDVAGREDGTINDGHPYVARRACVDGEDDDEGEGGGEEKCADVESRRMPPLFKIRQSAAATEQILMSLQRQNAGDDPHPPHFAYASSEDVVHDAHRPEHRGGKGKGRGSGIEDEDYDYHGTVKTIEEVLATAYGHSGGGRGGVSGGGGSPSVFSVGLRLPAVYGPWGTRGLNPEYDLAEGLISDAGPGAKNSTDAAAAIFEVDERGRKRGWMFVDDAVDAFVAAMQYRPEEEGSPMTPAPAVFDIAAPAEGSRGLGDVLRGLASGRAKSGASKHRADEEEPPSRTRALLGFSPSVALEEGAAKLLSWHLRPMPTVARRPTAATKESAKAAVEALLERVPVDPISRGEPVPPCASGCVAPSSSSSTCSPSALDDVAGLSSDLTDGCEIVVYTALFFEEEDGDDGGGGIPFEAENRKEEGGEEGGKSWPVVCNVAFVRRDGFLAKNAIANAPPEALKEFDGSAGGKKKTRGTEQHQRLDDALNGRLMHRGWILIWVPSIGASDDDFMEGRNILKIAPGAMFAPSAKLAVYVDGKKSKAKKPTTADAPDDDDEYLPSTYDDAAFLTGMMGRRETKRYFIDRTDEETGIEHRLTFPSERSRTASVLAREFTDLEAAKSLKDGFMHVLKSQPRDTKSVAVKSARRQKDMYSMVFSLINRKELRTAYEPRYVLRYRHWIESSWIAHDLTDRGGNGESESLRCEWYEEQSAWGNALDQASFAHVMALRELERRAFRAEEPDDEGLERMDGALTATEMVRKNMIESITDWEEWHPILLREELGETEEEGGTCVRVSLPEKIARMAMLHPPGSEPSVKDKCKDRFVRIVSARVLEYLVKAWKKKGNMELPAEQSEDSFYRGKRKIYKLK